jgi:hypothetical protein
VGLSITILGLLTAFVVSPVLAFLMLTGMTPGDDPLRGMDLLASLQWVTVRLPLWSLGVAILSALYSFVVFAAWFCERREGE